MNNNKMRWVMVLAVVSLVGGCVTGLELTPEELKARAELYVEVVDANLAFAEAMFDVDILDRDQAVKYREKVDAFLGLVEVNMRFAESVNPEIDLTTAIDRLATARQIINNKLSQWEIE